MIETYLDESFDHTAPVRVFAVGGWYGAEQVWRGLEGDWKRMLQTPCPPVREFATQDCYNGLGEFAGWSLPRRLQYVDRFVEIAAHHDIHGVVCVGLFEGSPPPVKHFDHWYCLFLIMRTLAFMASNCPDGDRITFRVDRRDKVLNMIQEAHRNLLASEPIFSSRTGPLEICDSETTIPIQTADLLAHAAFRSGREMADGRPATVSRRRQGLNPLIDKVLYQQFYRWNGHTREIWLLRESETKPDGEWVKWLPTQ